MHVAIAGNIGAGKTTLTKLLAKHYGWKPHYESVDENNCYSTDSIEIQIIDCSSIGELDKNSIILFPNPNDGDFTIFHKSQGDKIKTIRIFDTRNRLIESRNIRYIDNQISEKFNVKGISKGVYFVEMIGKVDNYYQKIIVN